MPPLTARMTPRHGANGHNLVDICVSARHLWDMDAPDDVIDARGLMCPLPVLRLAKALREAATGATVTIWADDPIAVIDVPHFCAETGHKLLSQDDTGSHQIYVVERR